MTWYLIWLLWSGDGERSYLLRFPMTSQTACTEARQGIKFPPSSASSVNGWNYGSATVAAWCAVGEDVTVQRLVTPPVPPP